MPHRTEVGGCGEAEIAPPDRGSRRALFRRGPSAARVVAALWLVPSGRFLAGAGREAGDCGRGSEYRFKAARPASGPLFIESQLVQE